MEMEYTQKIKKKEDADKRINNSINEVEIGVLPQKFVLINILQDFKYKL